MAIIEYEQHLYIDGLEPRDKRHDSRGRVVFQHAEAGCASRSPAAVLNVQAKNLSDPPVTSRFRGLDLKRFRVS